MVLLYKFLGVGTWNPARYVLKDRQERYPKPPRQLSTGKIFKNLFGKLNIVMFNIGDVHVVSDLQNGSRKDSTAWLALILELVVLCSEPCDEQSNVIT